MKDMRKLRELRNKIIKDINARVFSYGIDCIDLMDIGESNSPILVEGRDDENTFTLDRINVCKKDGISYLSFDGSSSWSNTILFIEEIGTDELDGILEWLEDYDDEIKEYAKQ